MPFLDFSPGSRTFIETVERSETQTARARAIQAHRCCNRTRNDEGARTLFLAIVDKGTTGLEAAMAGTPYAADLAEAAKGPREPSPGR